jgi:hypothetical protein
MHKNSIDKELKDLEKKHKVKLSEEARIDVMKWLFDIEVSKKKAEAKIATPPKIEVKEEKKQEVR